MRVMDCWWGGPLCLPLDYRLYILYFSCDCLSFCPCSCPVIALLHSVVCSLCSEQARLRQQVVEEDTEDWQRSPGFSGLERVGGVDLSFIKGDDVNACAQLVVLSYPDLEVSRPPHYTRELLDSMSFVHL